MLITNIFPFPIILSHNYKYIFRLHTFDNLSFVLSSFFIFIFYAAKAISINSILNTLRLFMHNTHANDLNFSGGYLLMLADTWI